MTVAQKILPKEDLGELIVVPFTVAVEGKELNLCLNVQKILEVMDQPILSPLPVSYRPFVGLFGHRFGPVPILDTELILKEHVKEFDIEKDPAMALTKTCTGRRILFCQLHNFVIGLLVNHTKRIEAVKNSNVLPIPSVLTMKNAGLFNGIIRIEDHFMYILDIENILNKYGVAVEQSPQVQGEINNFLKGKRVLVVEDSELFRKKVDRTLTKTGATCTFAEDGKAGLEAYIRNPSGFDLIFTDIEMPMMNGIEMVRKMREIKGFQTPVVFNSSISNPSLIAEIEKEKLGGYLVKFSEDTIIQKLAELFLNGL